MGESIGTLILFQKNIPTLSARSLCACGLIRSATSVSGELSRPRYEAVKETAGRGQYLTTAFIVDRRLAVGAYSLRICSMTAKLRRCAFAYRSTRGLNRGS